MKPRLCVWMAVMFTAVTLILAHAGDIDADKTKLLALENAWNRAQISHDSNALDGLVSDRYVYTDDDGTVMNKRQFLVDNKDPAYNATLMTNDDEQVISYENVAIVIGKYHAKGTYKGKAFDHWGRFTDTWVYKNSTWQCIATHTSRITSK
jgi:ketosteroid isomerase-like protein